MQQPMDNNHFLSKLIRENKLFFILFSLFLVVGTILLIILEKGDVIFFFSDNRSAIGNLFFFYFTKMGEELAFVFALLLLLFVKYRYAVYLPVLAFTVSFTSYVSKLAFGHDRPLLYFNKLGIFDQIIVVDGVTLNGGTNSFPSGHTMAAFALYTFLALVFNGKRALAVLLFFTAFLVGVSRIYLVQHFLEDVFLGAIIGVLLAVFSYYLQSRLSDDPMHWSNKSLRNIKRNTPTPSRFQKP